MFRLYRTAHRASASRPSEKGIRASPVVKARKEAEAKLEKISERQEKNGPGQDGESRPRQEEKKRKASVQKEIVQEKMSREMKREGK